MKVEVFNAHNKYMILKHALKENNVSQTCELFGISRTTYYNWNRAYEKHGMLGLEIKEPKKPKMPNKANRSIEDEILSHVQRFPTDGPKRIYYDLRVEGFNIGESGIYNVLKRYNLSTKVKRIDYSKNKGIYVSEKQKNKKLALCFENTKESYPGYVVIQRIDFLGTYDGIGKIYQYSLYDTYSKWGVVKLYNKKQDIDIWYYFELKLVYLMKTFNINIENLITAKTKEFVPYFIKGDKYKEIIENSHINHRFIALEKNTILDVMSDFNELLVKDFYNKIGTDKTLNSFIKVERALHKFLRHYNFSRVISSGCNSGKVPAKVILDIAIQNNLDLDTLPLWILALLTPLKEGDRVE
ncbi:helix-turn-helix domain-containing protein [Clostridium sp. CF012]|uniref:helix-turn-helix domain-containing protein n=1 Tax=Clostridium sp. CF012 TaxID=2843319 RepID=UPI001C0B1EEF|nr:helix-turn-helix domain-containing protein [Clostridium sp. CF012]MBU3142845.1 helix-turn-helix domain-containing protein [Clostridium sp. CF012]